MEVLRADCETNKSAHGIPDKLADRFPNCLSYELPDKLADRFSIERAIAISFYSLSNVLPNKGQHDAKANKVNAETDEVSFAVSNQVSKYVAVAEPVGRADAVPLVAADK